MEAGPRLLMVSSSGGVLLDLLSLRDWWSGHDRRWLVVDAADTRDALTGEVVEYTVEPSPRQVGRFVAAVVSSWRLIDRDRIGCVLTAGSAVALPVFVAARLRRIPAIWVETRNVVTRPGLAARLGGALATVVLVQHQALLAHHRRSVHVGTLY